MLSFLGISFTTMLLLGVPVAITLAAATLFAFIKIDNPMLFVLVPQRMVTTAEDYVLLAIPFFIMTGEIMNRAHLTDKIVRFAGNLVNNLRGGLAHTVIVSEIFFSGITGSAVADMVALGGVLIPAMEKEKYPKEFATAVTASAAVLGPIIPPSIPMLIYASVMNVSVAALFLAGLLPGIVMALCLMAMAAYISAKRGYGVRQKFPGLKAIANSFMAGFPALIMPVLIMGGILGGFFTPTQASAVACIYGLVVGFVFYKTLKISDIAPILKATVRSTAMILFILAAARAFSWVITYTKLVDQATVLFLSLATDKIIFLLFANLIMLLAGMFLDMAFSIIVLTPLMAPAAYSLGIDPIHFGLVVIFNLSIGLLSPPFGLILFAACGITNLPLAKVSKAIVWFLIAQFISLGIITYAPFFSLYLPRLFGYIK
ncbi:MAG: TRAP transporter large permease [Deltaproteobacteria bacterium]|nr:TRAP transporter large permease [Deltaproteobacteria bacterium]